MMHRVFVFTHVNQLVKVMCNISKEITSIFHEGKGRKRKRKEKRDIRGNKRKKKKKKEKEKSKKITF